MLFRSCVCLFVGLFVRDVFCVFVCCVGLFVVCCLLFVVRCVCDVCLLCVAGLLKRLFRVVLEKTRVL